MLKHIPNMIYKSHLMYFLEKKRLCNLANINEKEVFFLFDLEVDKYE